VRREGPLGRSRTDSRQIRLRRFWSVDPREPSVRRTVGRCRGGIAFLRPAVRYPIAKGACM
jgi:hypothetical protein